MLKRFVFVLVLLLVAGLMYGCGTSGGGSAGSSLPSGVNPGDAIPNPEVSVAGTASYSGGNAAVNLSPLVVPGASTAVSGLDAGRFLVYVSSDVNAASASGVKAQAVSWTPVDFTLIEEPTPEIDMAFILDNTGSMSTRIQGVKDSIASFTTSLQNAGGDIKFAANAFGDYITAKSNMKSFYGVEFSSVDFPSSGTGVTELSNWMTGLSYIDGNDFPENPLDAVMDAYNNLSWRPNARKVMIVITDNACHQINSVSPEANYPDKDTAYSAISSYSLEYGSPGVADASETNVADILSGNAVVYAVSPVTDSVHDNFDWQVRDGHGDVRNLADGLGASSRYGVGNFPLNGTGGVWIELPSFGDIDLTQLGITGILTAGNIKLTLPYSLSAGTYYIMVYVDTDADGTIDSYGMITIVVS